MLKAEKTWWEGFCQGNANANLFCMANQEIVISLSMYGNQACSPSNQRFSTLPGCGRYVTDILAQECNGKLWCSVGVNGATFGTTNCEGGENLYIEYICRKINQLNYFVIFFSWENCFPIVFSGILLCLSHWRWHYISPENTITKLLQRENTIILLVHSLSFWTKTIKKTLKIFTAYLFYFPFCYAGGKAIMTANNKQNTPPSILSLAKNR